MSADDDVRPCEYDVKKLDIEILLTNTNFAAESPHNKQLFS
jgi:hypothetical protein